MKIAILDDYQDVVKGLDCYSLLQNHAVTIFTNPPASQEELVDRLYDKDCIVCIVYASYRLCGKEQLSIVF